MGKIVCSVETKYEVGDVILFAHDDFLFVGMIEGYHCDCSAGASIWYNVRLNPDTVLSFSNGGDVFEGNIICKLGDNKASSNAASFIIGEEKKQTK